MCERVCNFLAKCYVSWWGPCHEPWMIANHEQDQYELQRDESTDMETSLECGTVVQQEFEDQYTETDAFQARGKYNFF